MIIPFNIQINSLLRRYQAFHFFYPVNSNTYFHVPKSFSFSKKIIGSKLVTTINNVARQPPMFLSLSPTTNLQPVNHKRGKWITISNIICNCIASNFPLSQKESTKKRLRSHKWLNLSTFCRTQIQNSRNIQEPALVVHEVRMKTMRDQV